MMEVDSLSPVSLTNWGFFSCMNRDCPVLLCIKQAN